MLNREDLHRKDCRRDPACENGEVVAVAGM